MKIKHFEAFDSRRKARDRTRVIYEMPEEENFPKDFRLCHPLRDASGSARHNIAEGFDAGSDAEFIRFLKIQGGQQERCNPNSISLLIANPFQRPNFKMPMEKPQLASD